MLKVARFLLEAGASVISVFFVELITGGGGGVFVEGVTIVGASGTRVTGAGAAGAAADIVTEGISVIVVDERTGLGGRLSFGSFSKGAEVDPSSALGGGVSAFISSRDFLSS